MKCLTTLITVILFVLTACGDRDSNAEFEVSAMSGIQIAAPFAYPAKAGEPVGVTYLNLANHGPSDNRLVSASSEVATRIETHETIEVDGVVKMRHREDGFHLPTGRTLTMEPGGHHLMLMEIQSDLVEGSTFQMTLFFEKGEARTIDVPIGLDIDLR